MALSEDRESIYERYFGDLVYEIKATGRKNGLDVSGEGRQ